MSLPERTFSSEQLDELNILLAPIDHLELEEEKDRAGMNLVFYSILALIIDRDLVIAERDQLTKGRL